MLEFVNDDVARITDLGSLDGYVDLVPLGRIETFCPVLEVESYLVGFFLCFAIFFRLDIEGDAWLRSAIREGVMVNSSVSLADFRCIYKGGVSAYRSLGSYFLIVKGREESAFS